MDLAVLPAGEQPVVDRVPGVHLWEESEKTERERESSERARAREKEKERARERKRERERERERTENKRTRSDWSFAGSCSYSKRATTVGCVAEPAAWLQNCVISVLAQLACTISTA